MLIKEVTRLLEDGTKMPIELNCDAIDMMTPYYDKKKVKVAGHCVCVLRCGVVIVIDKTKEDMKRMMTAYKS